MKEAGSYLRMKTFLVGNAFSGNPRPQEGLKVALHPRQRDCLHLGIIDGLRINRGMRQHLTAHCAGDHDTEK